MNRVAQYYQCHRGYERVKVPHVWNDQGKEEWRKSGRGAIFGDVQESSFSGGNRT